MGYDPQPADISRARTRVSRGTRLHIHQRARNMDVRRRRRRRPRNNRHSSGLVRYSTRYYNAVLLYVRVHIITLWRTHYTFYVDDRPVTISMRRFIGVHELVGLEPGPRQEVQEPMTYPSPHASCFSEKFTRPSAARIIKYNNVRL